MTPKPDKGSVKKKLQTSMSYELRHKNPQQNRGTCLAQLVEHVILHLGVVNLSPGRVQRLLKKLNKIMKCTYELKKNSEQDINNLSLTIHKNYVFYIIII